MDVVLEMDDITINCENTLILGYDYSLKKELNASLKKNYAYVDSSFSFATNTVKETLLNYNIDISLPFIDSKIKDLTIPNYFYLSVIVKLLSSPTVLIIDGIMSYLRKEEQLFIIEYAKKNNISLIILTNDISDIYLDFNIMVFHDTKLIIKGSYEDVIKENTVLKRLGYEVPFATDMSNNLKLYGMIDNICYSNLELEELLWK